MDVSRGSKTRGFGSFQMFPPWRGGTFIGCVWHPSRVRRVASFHPRVFDPRLLSCDPFRVLVASPKSIQMSSTQVSPSCQRCRSRFVRRLADKERLPDPKVKVVLFARPIPPNSRAVSGRLG